MHVHWPTTQTSHTIDVLQLPTAGALHHQPPQRSAQRTAVLRRAGPKPTVNFESTFRVPDIVILGYMHEETHGGQAQALQFFSAGPPATNAASFATLQKRVSAARAQADTARAAGVTAELAYIGISQYQALVDGSWKAAITNPFGPGGQVRPGNPPVEVVGSQQ